MWIILSLSASLIWAVVHVVDKFVLTKWIKNPVIPILIFSVVGLLVSVVACLFSGFSFLSPLNASLALVAGIIYILMNWFYLKAVQLEEVSRVVPFFYLTPLFTVLFAGLFLKEFLSAVQYFGTFLLIVGAVLITLKRPIKFFFNIAFRFMFFSVIFWAVYSVIVKYLLNFNDFWTIFLYIRTGVFIGAIPLFYFYLPELKRVIKNKGKKVLGLVSLNEFLNLGAVSLSMLAVSLGFVGLVSALSSTEPFFVLFFTVILSVFYPKILKEELSGSVIVLKLVAITSIFIGVFLIA